MKLPDQKEERKRTKNPTEIIYLDNEEKEEYLKDKKYYLKTYGCQMNVHDSEELAAHLENLGAHKTESLEDADIAILNTLI